jgi:outer membrane protein OmpA-like peptidoglycan-associated protein
VGDFANTHSEPGGREFYVYRKAPAQPSLESMNSFRVEPGKQAGKANEDRLLLKGPEAFQTATAGRTGDHAPPAGTSDGLTAGNASGSSDFSTPAAPKSQGKDDDALHLLHEGDVSSVTSGGTMIIVFDYGAVQPPKTSLPMLDELADAMTRDRFMGIIVRGYTDALGGDTYNKALSEWRASVVKGYLVAKGINRRRIEAIGMGAANPRQSNASMLGRRANRRVEIELRKAR